MYSSGMFSCSLKKEHKEYWMVRHFSYGLLNASFSK